MRKNEINVKSVKNIIISSIVIVFFGISAVVNGVNAAGEKRKNKWGHMKNLLNHGKKDFLRPVPLMLNESPSTKYTISSLGVIHDSSSGSSINNGSIVGWSYTPPRLCPNGTDFCVYPVPALFEEGNVKNLISSLPLAHGKATGINAGNIVGYLNDGRLNSPYFAFLSDKEGNITRLPSLGGEATAQAINNSGHIVGFSYMPESEIPHAVLWHNGKITTLGMLPGHLGSFASSINDQGDIVGSSINHDFHFTAFKISLPKKDSRKEAKMLVLADLDPTLQFSRAYDINNNGSSVGYSLTGDAGLNKAVKWDKNGNVSALNIPGNTVSSATAINDKEMIVGTYNDTIGFLYMNNTLFDLLSLMPVNAGWSNLVPYDIDEEGNITGEGEFNGKTHAFIMKVDVK